MNGGLRQTMAEVHTWAGLLLGWLLFAMFASGTAAYFQDEITRWMQPEVVTRTSPEAATQAAISWLERTAPNATNWYITPPGKRSATTQLFWNPAEEGGGGYTSAVLDGAGHKIEARETQGGYFLYRFHFDLHYVPVIWARYLVGIAAMFMLVAILSGIITHKKIFTDFFLLRFGKGQRSWLDAHIVTAVLALPFHLMITYTGLVTLASLYMPYAITANYEDPATFYAERFPDGGGGERSGVPVLLADMGAMMRTAAAHWQGKAVGSIRVVNPGDRNAAVIMTRASADAIGSRGETLTFEGSTGRLKDASAPASGASATESVMIGLHAGRFADNGLRWLYFLSGLFGTAMVGTGTILWCVKRRQRLPDPAHPHFGFRLVERLNIGMIAGFTASIAGYFLANRLLPLGMAARAEWEINSLFIIWGTIMIWAVLRPARHGWIESLAFTALLFALVPIVNMMTTPRGLPASLMRGDGLFVSFDFIMLLLACASGFAAWKMKYGKAPVRRRSNKAKAA